MKRNLLLLLFVVLPVSLYARPNQAGKSSPEVRQGEALYQQHCLVCHGESGGVDTHRYAPLLSKENMTSEGFVRKQITDGGQRMPGFKYGLEPSQINLIIGYLKTIEPHQAP